VDDHIEEKTDSRIPAPSEDHGDESADRAELVQPPILERKPFSALPKGPRVMYWRN
jgi:hypothetical protein